VILKHFSFRKKRSITDRPYKQICVVKQAPNKNVGYVWWRWRESNSRPKAFPQDFLRAQPVIYYFAVPVARRQAKGQAIP